jgi:PAS domain S-box-containing protein
MRGETVDGKGWPAGDSSMAARIRTHDWSRTALGPIDRWPSGLRTAVAMILDHPMPMAVHWGEELVQIYNDAYAALIAPKDASALGQPLYGFWPELRHLTEPMMETAKAGKATLVTDGHYPAARRGFVEDSWFTVSYSPIRGAAGEIEGVLATAFETTSRVLAERLRSEVVEQLGASEERYRLAMRAVQGMVFDWDVRSGHVERSEGLERLLGYPTGETEATAEWWRALVHPDDVATQGRPAQAAMERGEERFVVEQRLRHRDGRWIDVRDVGFVVYGEDGRPLRAVGSSVDVTHEKRLAAELQRTGERQALLLTIADALRPIADPIEIQEVASRLLGEHLGVDRCAYGEIDETASYVTVLRDYHVPHLASVVGRYELEAYGLVTARTIRRGEVFTLADAMQEPQLGDAAVQRAYAEMGVRAAVVAPLLKAGRFVALLTLQQNSPRVWTAFDLELINEVADRTWAAVERARAEAALARSETRFRSFAENSDDTLWIVDAETRRLEYLSPAFETMWGESRERILADLGRWAELVHPAERERALKGLPRLLAGKSFQQEYRIVRPSDGATRWIQDTGFPIRDDAGRIRHVGGIAQDVTERKEAEQELQRSRRSLRELVEGIPQLVWRAVNGGHWTWASPQWIEYAGLTEEASAGWGWLDAVHPEDQDIVISAWEQATRTRTLDAECRLRHRGSGSFRWFAFRARPVDPEVDDDELDWLGTSTEIHELRQLQEEQKVLVRELHHRTHNLMAVVSSIARQTGTRAETLEEFLSAFGQRLAALARVQGLLSQPSDKPITIGELLKLELDALGAAVGTGRIQLRGPEIELPRGSVQTLALALHELATNARKYGALAADDGTLNVHWTIGEALGERRLAVEWVEDRGSFTAPPTTSGGYGRQLIERALPLVLSAETRYEVGQHGVRCLISIPL